jgi:hypothetical protein
MTRRLLISYLSLAIVVLAMLEVPLGFVNARNERETHASRTWPRSRRWHGAMRPTPVRGS